jgi:vancomycin permeability regulator SanA
MGSSLWLISQEFHYGKQLFSANKRQVLSFRGAAGSIRAKRGGANTIREVA